VVLELVRVEADEELHKDLCLRRAGNQLASGAMASEERQERDHEEGIDEDVEVEGGEDVARIVGGPEAKLDGDDDGGVHKEGTAYAQHGCRNRE
jgi:hypothetical protein